MPSTSLRLRPPLTKIERNQQQVKEKFSLAGCEISSFVDDGKLLTLEIRLPAYDCVVHLRAPQAELFKYVHADELFAYGANL